MKTKTLTIGGKEYKVAELDKQRTDELLAWATKKLPDPIDAIADKIAKFSPRLQEIMIKDAMAAQRKPKALDNPDVQAVLATPEGLEQVLVMTFPGLSKEEVWDVHRQAVEELGENYLGQAN